VNKCKRNLDTYAALYAVILNNKITQSAVVSNQMMGACAAVDWGFEPGTFGS
jgi:hypothetical protein